MLCTAELCISSRQIHGGKVVTSLHPLSRDRGEYEQVDVLV